MRLRILGIGAVATLLAADVAFSQSGQQHWVATWAASPIATAIPAAAPVNAAPATPVVAPGAPAAAAAKPAGPPPFRSANNQTIRMVVNTSIGGPSVRVELANTFGADRLK